MICLGGVSSIYKRLSVSNCVEIDNYNPHTTPSTIWYTDCNNLYGFIMMKRLPHRGIVWITEEEIDNLDPLLYDEESDYGYILEVLKFISSNY